MEIEVNEFVRTNKGNFGKVILMCSEDYYAGEVIRATYKCDNGEKYDYKNINSEFYKGINQYLLKEEMILKHSKNIIDLIEPGDILEINNEKYEVIYDKSYEKLGILISNRHQLAVRHCSIEYIFSKDGIEEFKNVSILTHEQYNQNCYRLEE